MTKQQIKGGSWKDFFFLKKISRKTEDDRQVKT